MIQSIVVWIYKMKVLFHPYLVYLEELANGVWQKVFDIVTHISRLSCA